MRSLSNANIDHGLIDRDLAGSGKAVCKCGVESDAVFQSRNERRIWQQHHRDQINLTIARDKRRSYWVMNEAGISYRQLDFWVRTGYLSPQDKAGPFSDRIWSDEEMFVCVEMARLVRAGFTVAAAARIARRHVQEPSVDGSYKLELGIDIQFVN